jgi:hypothetical protein
VELVKCQTALKHHEFEYKTLVDEKERVVKETKSFLETKHSDEIKAVLGELNLEC